MGQVEAFCKARVNGECLIPFFFLTDFVHLSLDSRQDEGIG